MLRFFPISLAVVVSATAATAQLRITEVLVDPVGPDSGAQLVEVTNDWNRPVDLTGWFVSGAGTTLPLPPGVTIGAERVARIHIGRQGLSSPADFFLPAMSDLPDSGTFTLLRGADPNDPSLVEDFVAWNGGQQNVFTAVAAGEWPSSLESVALPNTEGASIAHYGDAAFDGPSEPSAWFQDRTPTLGLPNDPGSIFNLGMGCPNADPAPWIGLARPETRPWIGEVWEIDAYNLLQSVGMAELVLGSRTTAPQPLDRFGISGCAALIALEYCNSIPVFNGSGRFEARVPNEVGLVGSSFYAQAAMHWPGAPNPAQALVSNAVVCTIGSR